MIVLCSRYNNHAVIRVGIFRDAVAAHGAVFCSDISTRLLSYVLMILLRFETRPDFADRDVCHDDTSYAVVLLKSLRL